MSKACIHGRFQPFHLEHLNYFLLAFEKYKFLYIGITQPDIKKLTTTDYYNKNYRSNAVNNIFTYEERCEIIKYALVEAGILATRFSFLPFHIDQVESLTLPKNIICVSNIVELWNEHKVEKLRKAGYKVDILYKNILSNKMSSTYIRELISKKDDSWKMYVPSASIKVIEDIINNRFQDI